MHRAYLDWIAFLFIALRIVSGQMLFNSSGKSSECSINSLYSWQCDNGECIPMEELCDGIMNCADKSDESVEQCLHKPCPAYAFKCAYGGCITGTYQCNGIIDCVDGSDETRFLCDKSLNYGQTLRGSCWLSSQMQCKSGECLSGDRACDGIQDCNDGSDETVELCSFLKCPEYAFRCGYGACVSGKARCNGRFDCMDGSDESPGLCGNTNRPQPNITTTVRPPYRPPTTRTTTQAPVSTTLRPSYAPSTTRATTASPPSEKPTFSGKFCSPNTLMRGISTVASCSLNNNPVSCAHSLRIGTTAKISCAPGYMKYRKHPKETTTVFCDQDGEWSQSKFKCFPRCGELTEEQTKSITKPWDVTITRRSYMPLYLAICSGVIVSPKIVITAANCLESIEEGYATDHVAYNVIEGYYNSSYKEGDVLSAVVHNISAINIKTSPRSDDLAVLVLVNYFRFSDLLKPVCLPSIHNKLSLVGDMILNIGRGVTRDTSREYLEFLIARLGTVDSGRRTTNIEYIRISTFVPFIMREIKRYRHIL